MRAREQLGALRVFADEERGSSQSLDVFRAQRTGAIGSYQVGVCGAPQMAIVRVTTLRELLGCVHRLHNPKV